MQGVLRWGSIKRDENQVPISDQCRLDDGAIKKKVKYQKGRGIAVLTVQAEKALPGDPGLFLSQFS